MPLRDTKIDNIKGALMLVVIFGHMIEPLIKTNNQLSDVYNFIYLFHIPAFVFLSGYLSGYSSTINWDSLTKGLIIPLLIFSVVYELPDLIINKQLSGYLGVLTPNWILWFLVSMICWRILTPLVTQIRFAFPISILISILISLTSVDGYTYGVFRTVIFSPFYILGLMVHSKKEWVREVRVKNYFSFLALLLLIALASIDLPFNRLFLYCVAPFKAFGYTNEMGIVQRLEYYPIAFIAIILFSIMAASIKLFGVIGRNSLYVYLWHGLVVKYYFWPRLLETMPSTEKSIILAVVVSFVLGYALSSKIVVNTTNKLINGLSKLLLRPRLTYDV